MINKDVYFSALYIPACKTAGIDAFLSCTVPLCCREIFTKLSH